MQCWSCLLQILIHLHDFLQHFPSAESRVCMHLRMSRWIFTASLQKSVFVLMCVVTVMHLI